MKSLRRIFVEACVEYLASRLILLSVGVALLIIMSAPPWLLAVIVALISVALTVAKEKNPLGQADVREVENRHYTHIDSGSTKKKNIVAMLSPA